MFQSAMNHKVVLKGGDSKDDFVKATSGSVSNGTIYITKTSQNLFRVSWQAGLLRASLKFVG